MKTILVIEDNPEIRENIAGILEFAKYKVMMAANGSQGVDMAMALKPDLILCDIMMPILDGYSVLKIIGHDPSTRHIPFIFLTALGDKIDIKKGLSLGADDYVLKPFDGLELLHTIEMRLMKQSYVIDAHHNHQGETESLKRSDSGLDPTIFNPFKPSKVFHQREQLFKEGKLSAHAMYIEQGKIKTYKTTTEGKELITGLYKAGDFVGFTQTFDDLIYKESAVALEEAHVYQIPKEDFFRLILQTKEIPWMLIKSLSLTLIETQRRLLELAYHTVRQRMASTLLGIYEQYQRLPTSDGVITESRRDLSALIGTALESLNRTLGDFRDEGLIEISDSGIVLLDRSRLEKFKG